MLFRSIAFYKVNCDNKFDFTLIAVHLNSRYQKNLETQHVINSQGINEIKEFEKKRHNRSVIFGDFNHNPYENIFLHVNGFNAIPTKKVVELVKHRTVNNKSVSLRYNPMWNFLGDIRESSAKMIPGTFYFKTNKMKNVGDIHTNVLDQVIINREMLGAVDGSRIEIIDTYINSNDKSEDLIKNSIHHRDSSFLTEGYSDHLPITFEIEIDKLKGFSNIPKN